MSGTEMVKEIWADVEAISICFIGFPNRDNRHLDSETI